MLANGPTDGSFAEFSLQVMQAARAGKPLPAPPPPSPLVSDPADYAGVYQATDGRQLKFRAIGSDLVLDYNDQVVKLALTGPDQYCTRHSDLSEFLLRFGRQASKAGAELLFDVIATAYERSSVVVTTNLPFENWTEVLGNERLTGATLDRLTHRCHILETKGESHRLKEA